MGAKIFSTSSGIPLLTSNQNPMFSPPFFDWIVFHVFTHHSVTPLLHSILAMLSQIPTPAPGEIERWLLPAVAVLSIAALVKKLFPARRSDSEFVTKAELSQDFAAVRDKIDARFLTLNEKLEQVGTSLHDRLTELRADLARVDERTRK